MVDDLGFSVCVVVGTLLVDVGGGVVSTFLDTVCVLLEEEGGGALALTVELVFEDELDDESVVLSLTLLFAKAVRYSI